METNDNTNDSIKSKDKSEYSDDIEMIENDLNNDNNNNNYISPSQSPSHAPPPPSTNDNNNNNNNTNTQHCQHNNHNVDFQEVKAGGAPYKCPFCYNISFRQWDDWKTHWYRRHNVTYFDYAKQQMKLNNQKRNHTTMTNGEENNESLPQQKRQKISHSNNCRKNEKNKPVKLCNLDILLKNKQKEWIDFLLKCINNKLVPQIIIILSEYYQPPFTINITPNNFIYNDIYNEDNNVIETFANFDVDYTIFSTGYEMRILALMNNKQHFPNCVYLNGCIFHGPQKEQFLDSTGIEYNDKGEYILNDDNGNTKYLLSIIGTFQLGVIFKGIAPLKELLDIEYCHRWGLNGCEYTKHDGLKILRIVYDAESG